VDYPADDQLLARTEVTRDVRRIDPPPKLLGDREIR
jgi:hypothetical protein